MDKAPSPVPSAERRLAEAEAAFKANPNDATGKRLEDAQNYLRWAKAHDKHSN